MQYVDGFVVPVPTANPDAYRKLAETCSQIWREHGALDYRECVADDVKPGKLTSFPQSVQLKANETVVLSWIVFESRESRDAVNAKVMADPRMAEVMPLGGQTFDTQRMFWGGFKVLVDR
jgi:uncharacterized protein YbaA (DUF1428 family)